MCRANSGAKRVPAKKMTIKPFKKKPKLPTDFEQATWAKLKAAVIAIATKQAVGDSFEELYQSVENLCMHKMSENLYKSLETECELHISRILQSLTNQSMDHPAFLELVEAAWQDHQSNMITIRSVFLSLDRTYVMQKPSIKSIWEMGLHLFRQHLQMHAEVEKKLVLGLLHQIQRERSGETVNRTALRNLLRMFTALQIYEDKFEHRFLEETKNFYVQEGNHYIASTGVPLFLLHVEKRLQEESDRVVAYLGLSTRIPLIASVEKHLLKPHVSAILEKGFSLLMDEERIDELARMYQLFGRIEAIQDLKLAWNAYIKTKGVEIVTDTEQEPEMVERLLLFKARLDRIHQKAFSKNETYGYSLKEAWEFFINHRQNVPAQLLAKYIDTKLRSGNKKYNEQEIEALLDRLMVLFRYIHGKDVFEAFYKKDLAKRLLLGRSASSDLEKSMISKLKTECGNSFTNKLEGMFKDIDLSRDVMSKFSTHLQQQKELTRVTEPHVQVLTTGYWPGYTPTDPVLPQELVPLHECFKTFYLEKYNGRRITWQHSLGHCVLKAKYPKGRKELAVSLFQTVVLMLFNDSNEISFKDIKEQTGIGESRVQRAFGSIAMPVVVLW
jgi:cullin-4